jgi:hypothetical protein
MVKTWHSVSLKKTPPRPFPEPAADPVSHPVDPPAADPVAEPMAAPAADSVVETAAPVMDRVAELGRIAGKLELFGHAAHGDTIGNRRPKRNPPFVGVAAAALVHRPARQWRGMAAAAARASLIPG